MKEINIQLLYELDRLKERGVKITLEGKEVSPMTIIDRFVINEESDYMRDYILDEDGILTELGFYNIRS